MLCVVAVLYVSMAIVSCSFVVSILLFSPLDNQNMHDISKLSLIIGFKTSIIVSNSIPNSILCKKKSSIQYFIIILKIGIIVIMYNYNYFYTH